MDPLTALNPEQREAVLHIDGPLLILAGAGLGQDTRHRAAHRLSPVRGIRAARRDSRRHLHQQSRGRNAYSRRDAARRVAGGLVDLDVSRAVRPAAAARGHGHRPAARFRHLRLVRSGRARQAGAQGAADRRQRRAAADGAVQNQPREEHDGRAGLLQVAGLEPARRAAREDVREIHAGPAKTTARSTSTICC